MAGVPWLATHSRNKDCVTSGASQNFRDASLKLIFQAKGKKVPCKHIKPIWTRQILTWRRKRLIQKKVCLVRDQQVVIFGKETSTDVVKIS